MKLLSIAGTMLAENGCVFAATPAIADDNDNLNEPTSGINALDHAPSE